MSDLWPRVIRRGKSGQSNTKVQDLEGKQWRNEELRSLKERPPNLKEVVEKAARIYKAATEVGCDRLYSKIPLDM